MSEKPSEWIALRVKELTESDLIGAVASTFSGRSLREQAIIDYLDSRHDAQLEAEKRFRDSEQELPYG